MKGFQLSLFNGFMLGLERTKARPMWFKDSEGYGLLEFSGFVFYLGCFRLSFGSFDEFAEDEGS